MAAPKTHEEMIQRLAKVAVHLAQAASILDASGYRGSEAHKNAMDGYHSVMALKGWHESSKVVA